MAPTKETTRQQRRQALDHLNAALDEFDVSSSQEAIEVDTVQIQIRAANEAYADFVSWHNKFLDFRHEDAAMDVAHAESTAAFNRINAAKAKFLALKRSNPELEPIIPIAEAAETNGGLSAAAAAAGIPAHLRLEPKVFSGDPLEYQAWKEDFELVYGNTTLGDRYKYMALRKLLSGDALKALAGVSLDASGYPDAIKKLDSTFGTVMGVCSTAAQYLAHLPRLTPSSNLKEFSEKVSRIHVALSGYPKDQALDAVLVGLLEDILDEELRIQWNTHLADKIQVPTPKRLVEFISTYANIREKAKAKKKKSPQTAAVHATGTEPGDDPDDQNPGAASGRGGGRGGARGGGRGNGRGGRNNGGGNGRGGGRAGGQDQPRAVTCPSCSFPHSLSACPEFVKLDINARWRFVKEHRLCTLCLWKASHSLDQCTFRKCTKCQGMHNRSLHYSVMPQDNIEENSVPVASHNVGVHQHDQPPKEWPWTSPGCDDDAFSEIPAELEPHAVKSQENPGNRKSKTKATDVSVNMIGAVQRAERDDRSGEDIDPGLDNTNQGVLLMTAQVDANGLNATHANPELVQQVRALLDSAAQRSFISEHLVRKLGLVTEAVGTFKLSTLQDPQGVETRLKIVNLNLSSCVHPFNMEVECLVVNRPPAHHPLVGFNPQDHPHLRGLILSDDKAGSDSPIDILLGADALPHCLRTEPIIHPDACGPSAISTQFGYALMGHASTTALPQIGSLSAYRVDVEKVDRGKKNGTDTRQPETQTSRGV